MAFNFKSLNKPNKHRFNYDSNKQRPFTTLSKLYKENGPGRIYQVRGAWINGNDKFGARPEVVLDDYIVDMPRSLLDTFQAIIDDEEAVEAINNNECEFIITTWHSSTYNIDIYGIDFV